MEEDIKVLEEKIKLDKSDYEKEATTFYFDIDMIPLIENLIKRNKELEIENKTLKAHKNGCPALPTTGVECEFKKDLEKLEQEKKAIKVLKDLKKSFKQSKKYRTTYTLASGNEYTAEVMENILSIILTLIEKQQIELDNSISKNKIREVKNTFDEMVQKMYARKRELTDYDVFMLFNELLEGDK